MFNGRERPKPPGAGLTKTETGSKISDYRPLCQRIMLLWRIEK
jgi:hypothetical protein